MVDVVDKATRSRMMSSIKGKDTKPELIIRKTLFARGYRYRLHDKTLPGKPDLVLPKYHAAIFVNGCFWHKHHCNLFKWPATRKQFWKNKLEGTAERDKNNYKILKNMKWRVLVIWECTLKGKTRLTEEKLFKTIKRFLENEKVFFTQIP